MQLKTTADEAPRGLGPGDFENWLWKREKPKSELKAARTTSGWFGVIALSSPGSIDF
jgi:hypothetical protein